MFEKASRLKLRYKIVGGMITTEDLWNLSLEALDTLGKALRKEIAEQSEESLIKPKTSVNEALSLKFDIVKHVIAVKLAEDEARKNLADKRQRKQQLLELISQKENEVLSAKSISELRKELEAIED